MLTPEQLATFPANWIHAPEDAGVSGDDRAIAGLANQLPLEYIMLSSHLTKPAIHVQFEQILVWLQDCFRGGSNDACDYRSIGGETHYQTCF